MKSLNSLSIILVIFLATSVLILSYFFDKSITRFSLFLLVGIPAIIYLLNLFLSGKIHLRDVLILLMFFSCFLFIGNVTNPRLLFFLSPLMFLAILERQPITENMFHLLGLMSILNSFIAIIYSFFPISYSYNGDLSLVFLNPNMAGIVLSNLFVLIYSYRAYLSQKRGKILLLPLLIALFVLIYMTKNRGSLLVIFLLLFIDILRNFHFYIGRKIAFFLVLMPLFMIFFYIFLFSILPSDFELFGKPFFSGRETMWLNILLSLSSPDLNMLNEKDVGLNMFLVMISEVGVCSLFFYIVYMFLFLKHREEVETLPRFQYLAYCGMLFFYVQQSFESTLFTGSYGVCFLSYICLGISNIQLENNEPNTKEVLL